MTTHDLCRPQVHVRKVENVYSESTTPVNCAAEMKKRPPSLYASSRGNVMQKAKVNTLLQCVCVCVCTCVCSLMHPCSHRSGSRRRGPSPTYRRTCEGGELV